MKKTIITVIISVLFTILSVFLYDTIKNYLYEKKVEELGLISSQVKENYDLPKFEITTDGLYKTVIATEDINGNVPVYEIEAAMTDGLEKEYAKYYGMKLVDVLYSYDLEDFNEITFMSNGNLQVSYEKDEVTDNIFIVFEKNGMLYQEDEPVALLDVDLYERYSISNLIHMRFE